MMVLAFDGYNYLVKTNSYDDRCYLVNTKLEVILGYDIPEKFMRYGNYVEFDMDRMSNKLRKLITKLLKKN